MITLKPDPPPEGSQGLPGASPNVDNTPSKDLLWKEGQAFCSSPVAIIKKSVTPINPKTNILTLLKNHGNKINKPEVFKTIGNRIVIPMKVSVAAKKATDKSASSSGETAKKLATFQMAVPKLKDPANVLAPGILHKVNNLPFRKANTSTLLQKEQNSTGLAQAHVKNEVNGKLTLIETNLNDYGDLNKFMSSVTGSFGLASSNDDKDSVISSTDSSKLNTSMSSMSKLSDFDDQLEDNDLTCLSWLNNDKELYKTIRKCNPDDPGIGLSGDETDSEENTDSNKLIFTATSPIDFKNTWKGTHSDFAYNPMSKPPYSFSCLIFMAIEDSYLKRLPVKEIYCWVCKHFPYFRTAPSGWKNSIRHNLSLNRCFKKAECRKDMAKGSLWCIDPAYRPNLVQALKRSPFYPYLHPTSMGQPLSLNNLANLLPGVHTGRVPTWSPATPPSSTLWADPDMASAALNLMGLRGGEGSPKRAESITNTLEEIFRDEQWVNSQKIGRERHDSGESVGTEQLVISGSSQDHLYTRNTHPSKKKIKTAEQSRCRSPESEKSAPDAAYEFETRGFSEDDLDDDIINVIAEEQVIYSDAGSDTVDDSDDDDQQSLFDSGFASLRNYKMKNSQKRKLSNSLDDEESRQQNSSKRKRKEKKTETKKKTKKHQSKSSNSNSNKKLMKRKSRPMKVKLSKSASSPTMKKKMTPEKKNSDVDSGKDSPKVDRCSRGRRLKQRNSKRRGNSNYHTRSSGHKLLGQEPVKRKRDAVRKRNFSEQSPDEEEEIKLAAGSLLHLAGLLKSPLGSSKVQRR
ncbi:unnamed protein product [Clavelina lepadiformis]|uniref:Fork-head domain-containing protein n=1 Tax=Clavelina lepadiformis TaxID=159417 RepID=A0ABP0FJR0_CLALP